jgi:beta-N-acetylhexosaminidase
LFIGIDEEGGRVLRTRNLDVPRIPPAQKIGESGNVKQAYDAAEIIAGYLLPLGFNTNFAPVADVFSNPRNTVIGDRAFSADAKTAGNLVLGFTRGLLENNILPALKHFPGHGETLADSHFGIASTDKTLEELKECEFIPFQAGIDAGAPFVMTGHISTPNITGDNMPALFSSYLLRDILRGMLGFDGVIITDALNMGAVTKYYNSEETAVKAVIAGVDILLMPDNLEQAFAGIIKALESGEIPETRIDESVKRILTVKYEAGIIALD